MGITHDDTSFILYGLRAHTSPEMEQNKGMHMYSTYPNFKQPKINAYANAAIAFASWLFLRLTVFL